MHTDALIIGGSFAGLSAALQLARGRRSVCVLDGGMPRNRFAEASHGFFGQDGAQPRAMIEQARSQLLTYPTVTFVEGLAVSARQSEGGFTVELASGETVSAKRLLLASGVEDVLPELPGLAERWGSSVIHCPYCHGYEFGGHSLGVLRTQPASIHQALIIPDWGPTTFFLNGAPEPDPAELQQLRQRNVTLEPEPVVGLEGDTPDISGVRLADGRIVPVAALFIAPAFRIGPLAEQLGCELGESPMGAYVQTNEMKETTVPGVFAAGDISAPIGNVTFASAAGVMAASAMHRSLMFEGLQ